MHIHLSDYGAAPSGRTVLFSLQAICFEGRRFAGRAQPPDVRQRGITSKELLQKF
jgi:hypothetical protein